LKDKRKESHAQRAAAEPECLNNPAHFASLVTARTGQRISSRWTHRKTASRANQRHTDRHSRVTQDRDAQALDDRAERG
jgi:hypothetical protein